MPSRLFEDPVDGSRNEVVPRNATPPLSLSCGCVPRPVNVVPESPGAGSPRSTIGRTPRASATKRPRPTLGSRAAKATAPARLTLGSPGKSKNGGEPVRVSEEE